MAFIFYSCRNEVPQTPRLEQKCVVSLIWSQGVSRVGSFEAVDDPRPRPLSTACLQVHRTIQKASFVIPVSVQMSLYENTSPTALGPTPVTS